MSSIESGTRVHWWHRRENVTGLVDGVFEGGGGKGVLYIGALRGLLDRKLWFSSVAGSSAGAITAAMIAAGMHPDEMQEPMRAGLVTLSLPTTWNGIRRLRRGTGFLNHEEVHKWLRDVLRGACIRAGLTLPEAEGPTFEELYELTNIELYVVAVDLNERHVMVFSHELTPLSDVADAVMASATIPVAFEPLEFATTVRGAQDGKAQLLRRSVADGGIASNFPAFVFNDRAFRNGMDLPARSDDTPIVGFILEEDKRRRSLDELRETYREGAFIGTYHEIVRDLILHVEASKEPSWLRIPKFRPRNAAGRDASRPPGPRGDPDDDKSGRPSGWRKAVQPLRRSVTWVLGAAGILLLRLVAGLARLVGHDRWAWNWPPLEKGPVALSLTTVRRFLETAPGALALGVAAYTGMFWFGFFVVARWLASQFTSYDFDGFAAALWFPISFVLSLATLALAASVWLIGLGTFAFLRVAYPTLAVLGNRMLRALLQAPAAPPWAGCGPNERVVRLSVPEGINTLSVAIEEELLLEELKEQRRSARSQLEGVAGRTPSSTSSGEAGEPSL